MQASPAVNQSRATNAGNERGMQCGHGVRTADAAVDISGRGVKGLRQSTARPKRRVWELKLENANKRL